MRKIHCDEQEAKHLKEIEGSPKVDSESLACGYVKYFIKCLGLERKTSYKFAERPDLHNRQSAQPDYLFSECDTGKLIAIEYTRIYKREESTKNKAFIIDEYDKRNPTPLFDGINPPTPSELGERLTEFFIRKLSKGQFNSYTHAERILLCRNIWTDAGTKHFIGAQYSIECQLLEKYCDHIYVIMRNLDILEIF